MRILTLLSLFCASCTPVPALAIELVGDQIVVTPEERATLAQCIHQGGCIVVSRAEVMLVMQQVQRQTIEIAADVATKEVEKAVEICRKGKI